MKKDKSFAVVLFVVLSFVAVLLFFPFQGLSSSKYFLKENTSGTDGKKEVKEEREKITITDEDVKRLRESLKKQEVLQEDAVDLSGLSLKEALLAVFGKKFVIVFEDGVDVGKKVNAFVRKGNVQDACESITKSVGYVCKVDYDNRKIYVKAYEEAMIRLPFTIDNTSFKSLLSKEVEKEGGFSLQGELAVEDEVSRSSFEKVLKSFAGAGESVVVDWNAGVVYVKGSEATVERVKKYVSEVEKIKNTGVNLQVDVSVLTSDYDVLLTGRSTGNNVGKVISGMRNAGDVYKVFSTELSLKNGEFVTLTGGKNVLAEGSSGLFEGYQMFIKAYVKDDSITLLLYPYFSKVEDKKEAKGVLFSNRTFKFNLKDGETYVVSYLLDAGDPILKRLSVDASKKHAYLVFTFYAKKVEF